MKEITLKAHLTSIASKGGIARAKKLSKKRRLEISRHANAVKKAKLPSPTPQVIDDRIEV